MEKTRQIRKLLALSCAMVVVACASNTRESEKRQITTTPLPAKEIPDGVWQGRIDWSGFQADRTSFSGNYGLLIAACNGEVSIWAQNREDSNRYEPVSLRTTVQSGADTHVFSFIDAARKQPDWVEIHTYSMLEVSAGIARVQWTRAVNNRDLDPGHGNRTFFHYGTGEFNRTKTTCDRRFFALEAP